MGTRESGTDDRLYLGVDTGGTFTDLVLMDRRGTISTSKASTTPGRLQEGVLEAVDLVARGRGESVAELLGRVEAFGHGTTQATNALIERKGAKTALITTRGFGDTIFIQRLMGFTAEVPIDELGWYSRRRHPAQIIPRGRVFEVPERIDQSGTVLLELDEDAARRAVREMLDEGIEAIAVCLLWSFRNPVHEQRLKEIVLEECGEDAFLTLSSEISPVIGEYERTATTVLNSYLGPVIERYLESLEAALRDRGFAGTFAVLTSVGGVVGAAEAARRAVLLLTSGPTGGVIGSRYLAEALGHDNVITTDMGGTSFDVGLLINGRPMITAVSEVAQYHVSSPVIDITAVGSGGGSIAAVHDGLITVGPESAGAEPGPVCYGRGGARPTVTDADLVLGLLDAGAFLGGRMKLDRDGAVAAIRRDLADPLGVSVEEAAAGIRRIVDSQMADTLRELTIGRGHDPRDFYLYAYGGAGPLHCAGFGAELGVRGIVVPATSMVHSAYGALASDVQISLHRSIQVSDAGWDDDAAAGIEEAFEKLEAQSRDTLTDNSAAGESTVSRALDMRFRRQAKEMILPIDRDRVDRDSLPDLVDSFVRLYEDSYGRGSSFRAAGVEISGLRVDAVGRTQKPRLAHHRAIASEADEVRQVFDTERGEFVEATIHAWQALEPGRSIPGPAVLRHPSTTVYVGASQAAQVDTYGNLIIEAASA
jgi:N-methylhydantoinase A